MHLHTQKAKENNNGPRRNLKYNIYLVRTNLQAPVHSPLGVKDISQVSQFASSQISAIRKPHNVLCATYL